MKLLMSVVCVSLALFGSNQVKAAGLGNLWQQMQVNSPELNAAKMGYAATQEYSAQARAALLPSLSAGIGASMTNQSLSDQGNQEVGRNGYAVNLHMPLIDIAAWRQLDIAHLRQIAATDQWLSEQRALMMELVHAYFNLQNTKAQEVVSNQHAAQLQLRLKSVTARFEAGEVNVVDVDEVRAANDIAVSQAIEASSASEQAEDTLRQLTGSGETGILRLPSHLILPSVRIHPLSWWQQQAREHNDNIAVAQINREIAERQISKVKAGWLPRVDMVASWNHTNHSASDYQYAHGFTDIDDVSTTEGAGNSSVIGVQLTIPLYNGGATASGEREAVALEEQAKYQTQSVQNQVEIKTKQLYNELLNGEQRLRALQQADISSQKAFGSVELGYSLGDRVNSDVLLAEQQQDEVLSVTQAETFKYIINWFHLLQLTSLLNEPALAAIDGHFTAGEWAQSDTNFSIINPKTLSFDARYSLAITQ